MLEKYAPRFENLTPEQSTYLTRAVIARHPEVLQHGTPEPTPLWDLCDRAGLDQADVVMSLARDCTVQGVQVIEILIGHPITRHVPEERRARARRERQVTPRTEGLTVRAQDTRRITAVAPNPKKPRTASWDRYALYTVGMTLEEALAAGVTKADIRWDSERGFITVEEH